MPAQLTVFFPRIVDKDISAYMFKTMTIMSFLFLSACMVGPNFKEPETNVANHWLKTSKSIKETPIQDANWWRFLNDSNLTSIIEQGYQHNLPLQSAGVRVLQARAELAQVVGELYPQQQAMLGNLTYQHIGGSSFQGLLPNNLNTLLMGVTAGWELDFWGKYRRAILSNDAAFLAAYAAYNHALVSLTSDLATTYITIRTTEELIHITKQNITLQTLGLNIATSRFHAGETSLLDVQQAQTELSQTQSILPRYESKLQHQKDALAVLLGTTPDHIDGLLIKKRGIPHAPSSIAVGIPKEILAQRPDIYQARMEAIAQSEAIGATKANLYPSLSLTGTFAFASNTIGSNALGEAFNWSNRNISAGPAFNWPLFNYGQITNAVRAQDAVFQRSLLTYLNLVLQAQQQVQDSITQFIETKKSEQHLITANAAAIKSTQLAIIRYREGESDYTPVLDAERQQLQVQTSLTQIKGEIPKAVVALYRALGGGWQIRAGHDVVSQKIKHDMAMRTHWGSLLKQDNHQPPATKAQQTKERYLPNW